MDQAGDDPFLRQAFQVGARLAQFGSEEPHPADLELLLEAPEQVRSG